MFFGLLVGLAALRFVLLRSASSLFASLCLGWLRSAPLRAASLRPALLAPLRLAPLRFSPLRSASRGPASLGVASRRFAPAQLACCLFCFGARPFSKHEALSKIISERDRFHYKVEFYEDEWLFQWNAHSLMTQVTVG